MIFQTIELTNLATVTGGAGSPPGGPGPIKKCVYSALVAGSIALGHPAGQAHNDRASGPLHSPTATTTSQCK